MKQAFKHVQLFTALYLCMLVYFTPNNVLAQELKCQVTVNGQRINGVDARVFQNMQTTITEFMNNKVWTNDVFAPEERIECSLFINVETNPAQDVWTAKATIQASRPVLNSSYNSPIFNYVDNDWMFTFAENQPIEFNVTQYNANLSSLLGFYAYMILGYDYETFSKGGGAKYFGMAEQILNNVPTNGPDVKGWRAFDGVRNRYYMINHMQTGKYEGVKQALYEYHLLGLDNFYEKPAVARQNIINALDKLDKASRDNPNGILFAIFFQAKSDELVGIFSGADVTEKAKAITYLKRMDPSNAAKYDRILKN